MTLEMSGNKIVDASQLSMPSGLRELWLSDNMIEGSLSLSLSVYFSLSPFPPLSLSVCLTQLTKTT